MIHFFVGTKAQFIKVAPVMLELDRRQYPYRFIDSGQHGELTSLLRATFGIREPDFSLSATPTDVASIGQGLRWLSQAMFRFFFCPSWIRRHVFGGEDGICVVHGDTASTLVGALFAWRGDLSVAHLEAGLRSYNYFSPFPEELIRVWCMRLSSVLFAPDTAAIDNLDRMNTRAEKILTHGNTVLDALSIQELSGTSSGREPGSYVLATCHRMETIKSRRALLGLVECLNAASEILPVLFVLHKPTELALRSNRLLDALAPGVKCLPMQGYFEFVALLRDSRCVMADGGSIQEECAALGCPLLIMRARTERDDGLGTTATLVGFNRSKVINLVKHSNYPAHTPQRSKNNPSAIVADHLIVRDRNRNTHTSSVTP